MGISFEQVTYSYSDNGAQPTLALDALNLNLSQHNLIAVLGAPGSGKSTLLQQLNGLLQPDAGRICVLDYVLEAASENTGDGSGRSGNVGSRRKSNSKAKVSQVPSGLRRRVGLVFQFPEHQLFEDTIERDLCFGPLNFGVSEEEALLAARQAASAMGLDEELLSRSPFQLSSGQMRKAAIASVLASNPEILVLDEPTASLDPISREELMRMLQKLCKEQGRTVIIVTHRLEEVIHYADEFVVLCRGKLLFQGDSDALLDRMDVWEEAGIVPPRGVRMASAIAEEFGVSVPSGLLDADALAEWMSLSLLGGEEYETENHDRQVRGT